MKRGFWGSVLLSFFYYLGIGQSFTTEDYYLFPINPGQTNYLAGTMGEMRGTHFHGGIDIRTGGREGLPVYATADGYISRIKVQLGGYGHAVYMQHPNGTSSVYAHLQRLNPVLEQYLIEQQYKQQSYAINLFPEGQRFPYSQGEVIAYSGNSGSSTGPHLHFEIRNIDQRVLDPLKFGFSEIKDNIAPVLQKVAFVTLDEEARVNGLYGRYEFDVVKEGATYRTKLPVRLSGRVGLETLYIDQHNGSSAKNGIPEIVLTVDSDTVFHQRKASLSFSQMRNILVHMNYPNYVHKRKKYNRLYRAEGNDLDAYLVSNEGIVFSDEPQSICLLLEDAQKNQTLLQQTVNEKDSVNAPEVKLGFQISGRLHSLSK